MSAPAPQSLRFDLLVADPFPELHTRLYDQWIEWGASVQIETDLWAALDRCAAGRFVLTILHASFADTFVGARTIEADALTFFAMGVEDWANRVAPVNANRFVFWGTDAQVRTLRRNTSPGGPLTFPVSLRPTPQEIADSYPALMQAFERMKELRAAAKTNTEVAAAR